MKATIRSIRLWRHANTMTAMKLHCHHLPQLSSYLSSLQHTICKRIKTDHKMHYHCLNAQQHWKIDFSYETYSKNLKISGLCVICIMDVSK